MEQRERKKESKKENDAMPVEDAIDVREVYF